MPILALPEDTRRFLGSALVITSPIFLVKELLDNALDAGATTVEILISPNTVDRVEVRDNGSGISPSDFHHLGRPGHTSKLSSLKDLESVGCKSLGFRGVALASAAALAGIAICTRTSAESVATILHFSREGVAAARGHKPAPAGTSVCVTDLFGAYPVRLKRATSEATATVLKVKGLLECYALARPQVKLSFKVLGGKQSWSYVPTSGAALKDAVVQVMGRELAAQCMLQTSPFSVSDTETKIPQTCNLPLAQQPSKFVFEAYLPTTTADIRKICKGPFISVDSRPLSFTRGTAKKLKAVFEKHFKGSLIPENSSKLPGSPFIRLNIRCPLGSYDPNVEPSKYDVLFHNEELVLREFESFLLSIYPAKHNDAGPSSMDLSTEANGCVYDTGVADEHISTPQTQTGKGAAPTTPPTDEEPPNQSKEGLNPWTIAKLVAPRRQTQRNLSSPTRKSGHVGPDEVPPLKGQPVEVPGRRGNTQDQLLRKTQPTIENNRTTTRTQTCNALLKVGEAHSQPANQRNSRPTVALERNPYTTQDSGRRPADRRSYPTDAGRSLGMVQSRLSFGGGYYKRQRKTRTTEILEPLENTVSNANGGFLRPNQPLMGSPGQHIGRRTMDNTRRRTIAQTKANRLTDMLNGEMPVKSRTVDDLSSFIVEGEEGVEAALPTNDPRGYLIRRQQSLADKPQRRKIQRLKTNLLPLETTPLGSETHQLALTLLVDPQTLARSMVRTSLLDSYLIEGALEDTLVNNMSPEEFTALESRVKLLLSQTRHQS
ncbi:hypothetical protein GE21DRAFT_983 [Neurospora crassa]|uniref:MUTL-2 n=1 Tax=Neurospora crassa (strain ATCC 24698 / 74-OR23-1A / CBS 708.71 / DSM 1257 / FGSC 987) TaxID=367110 RepID=Q7SCN8_NEUCR|nr:MUTL-2 [Neurospora crassa OR74A]EAA34508.1 MUTL-2 [Neurospora crassa OR74A]KHE78426.1 hypothetical protein GE21DRAFT_983 [Neurospora crassa]|eukprot:XP_963744.1 MUTL-2 [Neurospora crassa OR74A]